MNNFSKTAFASAILIATLAMAGCDRKAAASPAGSPSGAASAPASTGFARQQVGRQRASCARR